MKKKSRQSSTIADAVGRYRIKLTVLRHDWRLYGVRSTPHRQWFRHVLSGQLYQVAYDPEFLEESDVEDAAEACEELGIAESQFARQLRYMRDAADGLDRYRRFMQDHIVELGDAYSAEVYDLDLEVSGRKAAASKPERRRRKAETTDAVTRHFDTLVARLGLSGDDCDIPESAIAESSVMLDRKMLAEQSIDLVFAHVEEEMDFLISDEIDTSLSLDDLQPVWRRTHLDLGKSTMMLFALSDSWKIGGLTINFEQIGNKCGHGWNEYLKQ